MGAPGVRTGQANTCIERVVCRTNEKMVLERKKIQRQDKVPEGWLTLESFDIQFNRPRRGQIHQPVIKGGVS